MGSYTFIRIREKAHSLIGDSLETIAETILDLEDENERLKQEVAELTQEIALDPY